MKLQIRPSLLPTLLTAALALPAAGQTFPADGTTEVVGQTGSHVDYVIPTVDPPQFIELLVKGAGGGSVLFDGFTATGGRGIRCTLTVKVGYGPGELVPGGTLRVIPGNAGGTYNDPGADWYFGVVEASGGGGGGSAVLYAPPGFSGFTHIAVAGGGGGALAAYVSGFSHEFDGQDARSGECGGALKNFPGGCNGAGGAADVATPADEHFEVGGGGGGAYGLGGGPGGGSPGLFVGSPGGTPDTGQPAGGWGYGSGGAGTRKSIGGSINQKFVGSGGGGGYSGGAAGGDHHAPKGAGGGGSYVNPLYASAVTFDFDDPRHHGWVELSPGSIEPGSTCAEALVLPDPGDAELPFAGVTTGTTQLTSGCVSGLSTFSAWYSYTNPSPCGRMLVFSDYEHSWPGQTGEAHGFEVFGACGGSLLDCSFYGGTGPGFAPAETFVPSGETVLFRFLSPHAGSAFSMSVSAYAFDPGSADDDDGDGVPNACDTCIGDDFQDSDQDGIPDACDPCSSAVPSPDCDGNGVEDACDLAGFPQRFERFDGSLSGGGVSLNGEHFAPAVVDGTVQLGGKASSSLGFGSVVFEPVSPAPVDSFHASFFTRTDSPASFGHTFSVLDAATHPLTKGLSSGSAPDAVTVSIGNAGGVAPDGVALYYDKQLVATATAPFPLDDGTWRHFEVELFAGRVTVRGGYPEQPPVTLLDDVALPGFQPFRARYGFGAASGNKTSDENRVFVDQVTFVDRTGGFPRDIDGDGVLDACEPLQYLSVKGVPANPEALVPTASLAPVMGESYQLTVDHATFLPDAFVDALLVSAGLQPVPIPPTGTLLVSWPPLLTLAAPAGAPFDLPIPYDPGLHALPVTFQALSFDVATSRLTNAVVAPVAGWRSGL